MYKKIKRLCNVDDIIVFLSITVICGNIGFVIAKTLEISLSQIINSAAIGSGVVALTVLAVAAITRVLDLRKEKVAIFTEKLEN